MSSTDNSSQLSDALSIGDLPDFEIDQLYLSSSSESLQNLEPRIGSIIQWWEDHSTMYLALSRMALDILSIPAMSAEVERVFSSAKLLISDTRNRLKEDIIEACECLKSFNTAGLYSS